MANEPGPSSQMRESSSYDLVDQVNEDAPRDDNTMHSKQHTENMSGMFDIFMRKFADMSKTMTSVQKELIAWKSDRSSTDTIPDVSRKRGQNRSKSTSPPRKKTKTSQACIRPSHELSDNDSDVENSDKSDADEALNSLIEGDDSFHDSSDDDEVSALNELSEFFGDEDKTSEPLSSELAKIMEKMFMTKTNSEKIKEISNKYDRPKNINNISAPKVNKVIWENMSSKNRASDIKLQTTQNLIGKAMIPTLRLFDMLINCNSKKGSVDVKKAKQLCGDILKFQKCVFHNLSYKRREQIIQPEKNKQFVSLCSAESFSENLFGDDLGSQVKNVLEAKKLAQKIGNKDYSGKYRIPKVSHYSHSYGKKPRYGNGKGNFLAKQFSFNKKKKKGESNQ
ncbi:uncharacterized protein LOC134278999 [Saccostrea cucullata]|uniref:uncharacterized protein LOC134278999 n=1 Tax=Saccostrea cuccullata TaxID=36930 RepID=UPI002ED02DF9